MNNGQQLVDFFFLKEIKYYHNYNISIYFIKKETPNLSKFVQAFEDRKSLKEYIASFPKDEQPIVIPLE